MVFDKIENLGKYLPADKMAKLAPVIAQLTPDCEERKYDVDGDNIFIKAMSYTAIDPAECKIEAHDKYIDIQVTITGSEGISVFERDALDISVPYDEAKDMLKLTAGENVYPVAHVAVNAGYFAMLWPHEAHRPKEIACPLRKEIKKYVIKVKI